MSWQTYVDTNLVGSGHVQKAAIHGHDGSCWATSSGFSVSTKEASDLIGSLKDGSVSGKDVGGERYMMLRNNEKTAYLKLKDKGGFCVCLTGQSLVIGGYSEGSGAGNCNNVVEGLSQYLKDQGY